MDFVIDFQYQLGVIGNVINFVIDCVIWLLLLALFGAATVCPSYVDGLALPSKNFGMGIKARLVIRIIFDANCSLDTLPA